MRFRRKVFTPLLMVAVFTAALIVFVGGPMMDLRRTKVLAISATAPTMLDRDVHQNFDCVPIRVLLITRGSMGNCDAQRGPIGS